MTLAKECLPVTGGEAVGANIPSFPLDFAVLCEHGAMTAAADRVWGLVVLSIPALLAGLAVVCLIAA